MVTLTHPSPHEPGTGHREDTATVATIAKEIETALPAADVSIAVEEMLADALPSHRKSLPVRMARGFLAFYDWLTGPPMSKRDRLYRNIAEAGTGRFFGSMGPSGY